MFNALANLSLQADEFGAASGQIGRLIFAEDPKYLEFRLKSLLKARRRRAEFFPNTLFSDPAWDVLLELSLGEIKQYRTSISSLCASSGAPQTTALRWIKAMTDDGWLVREDDPLDARRKFVMLSDRASANMHAYLLGLDVIHNIRC